MKASKQSKPTAESSNGAKHVPFLQRKPSNTTERPFISAQNSPQIQPKLSVNEPGDKYEQEADRMAERVMRMPMDDGNPPMISGVMGGVQRKCAACEAGGSTCSSCAAKEEKLGIQRKSDTNHPIQVSDTLASRLNQRKVGGLPLSPALNEQMSTAFQKDFSGVRLHTDAEAVSMSDELNAQAFTYGQDIYFNAGKFQPETREGRGLLGHELTHTVQQGGGGNISSKKTQRRGKTDPPAEAKIDVLKIIQENYPHLASVLSKEQISGFQFTIELRAKIAQHKAKYEKASSLATDKLERLNTRIKKVNRGTYLSDQAMVDVQYIGNQIDKQEDYIYTKHLAYTDKLGELEKQSKHVLEIPTIQLLDTKILELQSYNVVDEDKFRRSLFEELISKPITIVLLPGLEPNPLLSLFWGRVPLSHQGGLITFENLMNIDSIRWNYFEEVKEGPTYTEYMGYANVLESGLDYLNEYEYKPLRERAIDQPEVNFVAELFGGADMPSLEAAYKPYNLIWDAKSLLYQSRVEEAAELLTKAALLVTRFEKLVIEYKNDTQKGAGRAVKGLKFAEILGTISATILTGGKAGMLKNSLAMARGAGAYGMLVETASQASEYGFGLRNDFDLGAIGKRGIVDASTTLASGLISGKVSGSLAQFFKLSEKTGAGRFIRSAGIEFLSEGVAGGAVTAASNFKDLIQGKIGTVDYLKRIGWDGLKEGAIGSGIGMFGKYWESRGQIKDGQSVSADPTSWNTINMQVAPDTGIVTQRLKHKDSQIEMTISYSPISEKISISDSGHFGTTHTSDAVDVRKKAQDLAPNPEHIEKITVFTLGKDSHQLQVRNIGGWKSIFVCSNQCGPITDKINVMLLDLPNTPSSQALREELNNIKERVHRIEQEINGGNLTEKQIEKYTSEIGQSMQQLTKTYPQLADMLERHFKPAEYDLAEFSIAEIKSLSYTDPAEARRRLAVLISSEYNSAHPTENITPDEVMSMLNDSGLDTQSAVTKWELAVSMDRSNFAQSFEAQSIRDKPNAPTSSSNSESEILGAALEQAGFPKPSEFHEAHHIVERNASEAAKTRALLEHYGIDINGVDNGCWLARRTKATLIESKGSVNDSFSSHDTYGSALSLHSQEYIKAVEARLIAASIGGEEAIRRELNTIRDILAVGDLSSL